jgi:hypothetical protein
MSLAQQTLAAIAALRALPEDGVVADPNLPYAKVLAQPEQFLGRFETLPAGAQAYLRRFHSEEESVRVLAHGPLCRSLAVPGAALSRTLYEAERLTAGVAQRTAGAWQARVENVRQGLRRAARESAQLPFLLRRWLHRVGAQLGARLGRHDLATILRAQGFDARTLGYGYLDGLEQLHGCESVAKRRSGSIYAQLVGLDFVKSDGRYWFLEANCNPVLMDARLALYEPGKDPWVNNFLQAAASRGYERLVVYGYRPFAVGHGAALIAAGARLGIRVEIINDLFSSARPGQRRAWLMQNGAAGPVFTVRAKTFDVLFDATVLSKRLTRRVMEQSSIDWPGVGAGLPRLFTPGEDAPNYVADSRYPNIVAKRDGLDRGTGISFYKLPRLAAALRDEADFFEEYRVPEPVPFRFVRGERVPLSDGHERAWKIRSYALLTPDGVEYLSSIKVICGAKIPERLPDGLVARKSIYLATINEGGFYSAVMPEEDADYRRVVDSVGGALLSWLRRKYAPDCAA